MKPVEFGKELVEEYKKDKVGDLSAALAYYATFSIVPMVLLAIAIGGMVFGQSTTQEQLMSQLEQLVGSSGAEFISTAVSNSNQLDFSQNLLASLIALALMLAGATRFFAQFQEALNRVWNVEPREEAGFKGVLRKRAASFGVLLGIGVLMIVSTIASAIISGIVSGMSETIPGLPYIAEGLNFVITLALGAVLFGAVFKYFPDAEVRWRDVKVGAVVTTVLLLLGKFAIGLYIGSGSLTSTYGAAASIIIFLLWMYVSMQIVLIGAEFTQVWANRHGRVIAPEGHAQPA